MSPGLLLLLALGLSMDAFAVAVVNGITLRPCSRGNLMCTALFFGGFQGLMPLVGYLAGCAAVELISAADHYVALGLLGYLGVRMIADGVGQLRHPDDYLPVLAFSYRRLLVQALATSIDALAVGLTLAALAVNIWSAALIIGVVTTLCCWAGGHLGRRFGRLLGSQAELLGGFLLAAIGVRIFLEHFIKHY